MLLSLLLFSLKLTSISPALQCSFVGVEHSIPARPKKKKQTPSLNAHRWDRLSDLSLYEHLDVYKSKQTGITKMALHNSAPLNR